MKSVILIACFLPLVIIYVIIKFVVWISATKAETTYVKKESKKSHGPYLADAYADVDEEEEKYWNISDN